MEHVDWDDLRLLLAIAREGTMRSAAAACDLSAATLSRRLTELERRLGEPLIDRVPSGCAVTAFGQRVLAWAGQMEALAHQIERAGDVTGSHGLEGTVRINAVEWMSYILMKLLGSFQERFPGLAIEVLTSQQPYNLARREAGRLFDVDHAVRRDLEHPRPGSWYRPAAQGGLQRGHLGPPR